MLSEKFVEGEIIIRGTFPHIFIAIIIFAYTMYFYFRTESFGRIYFVLITWVLAEILLVFFKMYSNQKTVAGRCACSFNVILLLWYLALIVVISFYLYLFYETNRNWQIKDRDKQSEQYILVMGSKLENDQMPSQLVDRLDALLACWKYSDSSHTFIVVAGGTGRNNKSKVTEADLMYKYLSDKGIPHSQIIKEEASISTFENIMLTKNIWERSELTIVSSDYHLPRVKVIMDDIGCENYGLIGASTDKDILPYIMFEESFGILAWKLGIY